MQKLVPYEKLSKKKQRELNAMKRGSWGGLNPEPVSLLIRKRITERRLKDGEMIPALSHFIMHVSLLKANGSI